MKRQLPIFVSIAVGLIVVLEYFFTVPWLTAISQEMQSWVVLVSALLIAVGMVNLFQVNIRAYKSKKTGVLDLVVLLGGMVVMFVVTLYHDQFAETYNWMFYNVYSILGTAASGILMYSTASATFRGLRAKSLESVAFLLAALIGMLGLAPVGEAISASIPAAYDWVLTIPNVAGQRGITIGASIGAMTASLRVILGIERRVTGLE